MYVCIQCVHVYSHVLMQLRSSCTMGSHISKLTIRKYSWTFLNRFHCTYHTHTCIQNVLTVSNLCKAWLKTHLDQPKQTQTTSFSRELHYLSSTIVIASLWSDHTNVFGRISWNNKQRHQQLSHYYMTILPLIWTIKRFNTLKILLLITYFWYWIYFYQCLLESHHCSIFQHHQWTCYI